MTQFPKIGAYVLETLTTGMYTNPLDTLREFVQNAADSIRTAEEEKVLTRGQGCIEIEMDPTAAALKIRDNGKGIVQAEASDRLLNIGMSMKRIDADAGFRGIGRLAAIAYCKRLHFRAKAVGEAVTSVVEIDCEGLRRAISPTMRQTEELTNVLARNSHTWQERTSHQTHMFEVVMEGITDPVADVFLNWQKIEAYLSQVAPVEYDAQHFIYAPVITNWINKNRMPVPTATLVIRAPETERQVFKPYRTRYKTRRGPSDAYNLEIKDVLFWPDSPSPNSLFWIWYGKSELLGMIDDDRAAGFRLRKNNIGIGGPERVAQLFADVAESDARFNDYYVGEVHILSSDAIPNARRDGFEDGGTWPQIRIDLMPFVKERREEIRSISDARNRPTVKLLRSANKVIGDVQEALQTGIVSERERAAVLERVVKEEEKVKRAVETRKEKPDAGELGSVAVKLKEIEATLKQENNFAVKKLKSHLDRKQRQVLKDVLAVLYDTLDEANYKKAKEAILAKFQITDAESNS